MAKRKQHWIYEKFLGNGGIYAICPVCKHRRLVGSAYSSGEMIIADRWKGCPICETKFYPTIDKEVNIIWNERTITNQLEYPRY